MAQTSPPTSLLSRARPARDEAALPPISIRAARLAKQVAQLAGMPIGFVHLGCSAGPIVHMVEDCDPDVADPVVAAWSAPERAGPHPILRPDSLEPEHMALAVSAPVSVSGRKGWVVAVDPAATTATDRHETLADFLVEVAEEWDSQAEAQVLWADKLTNELQVHETIHHLTGVGIVQRSEQDGRLTASRLALSILKIGSIATLDELLAPFATHDRHKLRARLAGEMGTAPFHQDFDIDTSDDETFSVRLRCTFAPPGVEGFGWVLTVEDITEVRREHMAMRHLAERDPVTGLYNRHQFAHAVDEATAEAQRTREYAGLILVTLDEFKDLVQRLGHTAGDAIIRFAARVLSNNVRGTDTVVRLGGDEFAVVLPRGTDDSGLMERATRIRDALCTNATAGNDKVKLTACVGLAVYPTDTAGGTDIHTAAAYALSEAVRDGPGSIRRYDPELRNQRDRERAFVAEVREAILNGEFEPFFQPKVDLETGLVVGFEALCRWRHPVRGTLSPGAFYKALESPGVGAELSDVALMGSFRAAAAFHEMGLDFGHISINLNTLQLGRPDLSEIIEELQQTYKVSSPEIVFEVLENVLIREKNTIHNNLHALSEAGFTIALDDFGTGFASLTHIREPFIREVKIDRSFVTNAGASPSDQQIVAAIVQMARKLGLRMVAEGIEDEETLRKLRAIGCTVGQGFVFAPALPFEEAAEFLGRQNRIYSLLEGSCL